MKNELNIDIFNIKIIYLYFKIRNIFNKNTKKKLELKFIDSVTSPFCYLSLFELLSTLPLAH